MPCTSLASNEAAEQKGRITVEFRYVGNSGFKISEITYGNWLTHGSQVENDQAKACVRAALDAGISTFDTADVYANTQPRPCWARP
jgi:predicted oxidoreductase